MATRTRHAVNRCSEPQRLSALRVQEFVAALAVTVSQDPRLVPALRGFLAAESPSGPAGRLLGQLSRLLTDPGFADAVGRLATDQ